LRNSSFYNKAPLVQHCCVSGKTVFRWFSINVFLTQIMLRWFSIDVFLTQTVLRWFSIGMFLTQTMPRWFSINMFLPPALFFNQ